MEYDFFTDAQHDYGCPYEHLEIVAKSLYQLVPMLPTERGVDSKKSAWLIFSCNYFFDGLDRLKAWASLYAQLKDFFRGVSWTNCSYIAIW